MRNALAKGLIFPKLVYVDLGNLETRLLSIIGKQIYVEMYFSKLDLKLNMTDGFRALYRKNSWLKPTFLELAVIRYISLLALQKWFCGARNTKSFPNVICCCQFRGYQVTRRNWANRTFPNVRISILLTFCLMKSDFLLGTHHTVINIYIYQKTLTGVSISLLVKITLSIVSTRFGK